MSKEKLLLNVGNDYYESSFNELCEELENGKRVQVYVDCIGHTRNNWVQDSYRTKLYAKYGEELLIECSEGVHCYHYTFELIPGNEYPYPEKRIKEGE